MSRLESENEPRFEIEKESEPVGHGLAALPLHLRKQAIAQFDGEFQLEDLKRAEHKLMTSSSIEPEIAEMLLNARSLFEKGEVQIAQDLYERVLRASASNEIALRGLANCEQFFFRHEKALEALQRLVRHHKNYQNYKSLADQLYAMSYLEDAVEAYMRAMQDFSAPPREQFEIYKNLGNILLRLGDADGAEEFYNKSYTINPDSDVLFVNYGSLYVYRGDYNKALHRFRQAIQLNDKNDKAWVGLAMIHREFGDLELAWANVEKALDIHPANQSAIKLVCDWAMKDNEIEKAIRRIRVYLETQHDDAIVTMWFAKFLYLAGQLSLAKSHIDKAIMLNPNLEGAFEVKAVIESEMVSRGPGQR
jgi:tetratricopeptide (TPR) repeat protein